MLKLYCTSCGKTLYYDAIKPKFCGECGEQIGLIAKKTEKTKQKNNSEDDEEETNVDCDSISELKVQISLDNDKASLSNRIGDLGQWVSAKDFGGLPKIKGSKNKRTKKIDKKQVLEEFRKKAGGESARGKFKDIENTNA